MEDLEIPPETQVRAVPQWWAQPLHFLGFLFHLSSLISSLSSPLLSPPSPSIPCSSLPRLPYFSDIWVERVLQLCIHLISSTSCMLGRAFTEHGGIFRGPADFDCAGMAWLWPHENVGSLDLSSWMQWYMDLPRTSLPLDSWENHCDFAELRVWLPVPILDSSQSHVTPAVGPPEPSLASAGTCC